MKNITHLCTVFAFLFSSIVYLKANSWEKTKAAENLIYRIETQINTLQKEKVQQQTKLDDPNAHLSDK